MFELNYIRLKGPAIVTIGYFILWYYLLFFWQIKTKYKLAASYKKQGKVFDRYFGQDIEMLLADRAVINTQEQMMPFLFSMWLYAIFVSPTIATYLGSTYVILRSIYPFLLKEKMVNPLGRKIALITIPCYLLIFFMFLSTMIKFL